MDRNNRIQERVTNGAVTRTFFAGHYEEGVSGSTTTIKHSGKNRTAPPALLHRPLLRQRARTVPLAGYAGPRCGGGLRVEAPGVGCGQGIAAGVFGGGAHAGRVVHVRL
jgi:hypothetical protein